MDIYRFLDSNDIRAHLQSLRYDFTLPEAAFLVWQCATAPLSEKHAAWRELIKTMPDCRMERRRNMCEIQSMHGFLQEYIELEEKQLREQLYAAVMALPDKQAKRIYAHFYLGMTPKEIAQAEGVDPGRVRDSIRKGLRKLAKQF